MNQFDIQEGQELRVTYTRLDKEPSVSSLSSVHTQKLELLHQFLEATVGSFILTFGVLASNNNTLAILLIFLFSAIVTRQPTIYNPAVTLMETMQGLRTVRTFWASLAGQLVGSMMAAMFCYFVRANTLTPDTSIPPYWDATLSHQILGVSFHNYRSNYTARSLEPRSSSAPSSYRKMITFSSLMTDMSTPSSSQSPSLGLANSAISATHSSTLP